VKRLLQHRACLLVELGIVLGFMGPVALAQKPPSPTPRPSPPPGGSANPLISTPTSVQPTESRADLVMFLMGRVATADGTPVPRDAIVERVCNSGVRQQVHITMGGDFSMQLGSRNDTFLDASGDRSAQSIVTSRNADQGIPRRELANCDLRASAAGFSSNSIPLVELSGSLSTIDVGAIVVQRRGKVEGLTLNASPYQAPKDARKAYEKGLEAQKKGKLPEAQRYFGKAVEIYPKYAYAWFKLGTVLQKEQHKDAASAAFTKATTIDKKFLPPYLSLAVLANETQNWPVVLELTNHILSVDPLNHVAGYVWDLDQVNYSDAYFYNALANYRLNKFEEAEKSGRKAEQVDLPTRFPQLHLLLADLFARKKNYGMAIAQLQTYLELTPYAKDTDQVRTRLVKYQELNASLTAPERINQK
jgi:tetratricopeptide (TPR) repeat protein